MVAVVAAVAPFSFFVFCFFELQAAEMKNKRRFVSFSVSDYFSLYFGFSFKKAKKSGDGLGEVFYYFDE